MKECLLGNVCLKHRELEGKRYPSGNCIGCVKDHQRKRRKEDPIGETLRSKKRRARRKGQDFNLEKIDIKIPKRCPVLGIKLNSKGPKDFRPSIDRIDNSRGYVRGNIVVVSGRVNRIKSDATIDELKKIASFYDQKTRNKIGRPHHQDSRVRGRWILG